MYPFACASGLAVGLSVRSRSAPSAQHTASCSKKLLQAVDCCEARLLRGVRCSAVAVSRHPAPDRAHGAGGAQERFIELDPASRWVPIKQRRAAAGILVLKDRRPGESLPSPDLPSPAAPLCPAPLAHRSYSALRLGHALSRLTQCGGSPSAVPCAL